ncbi:MAG: alpha-ribazole phosphatase family protein [Prevotellaceae bacterium]|nr:alpha-ribazole phosphatase family protein [Candidatus Faecinaster equi]
MQVYLIRHTKPNVPIGTCYGQSDVDIAPTFREEATGTLSLLKGIQFDKVYCSPLRRATKLAVFCGYPDAERDDRLMEMNMGEWEMRWIEDIPDVSIDLWYDQFDTIHAPGGETFDDLYNRIVDFLNEKKKEGYNRIALFCHGGPILCARVFAGQIKKSDGFKALTPFAGIDVIDI